MRKQRVLAGLLIILMFAPLTGVSYGATQPSYQGHVTKQPANHVTLHSVKTYLDKHPYQKKAAIGAGIGAAAGVLLSPRGAAGSGLVRGAILGAGAGAGYEYLKQKGIIDKLMKEVGGEKDGMNTPKLPAPSAALPPSEPPGASSNSN